MVSLSVKFKGNKEVSEKIRNIAEVMRPQDRGKLNKQISIAMFGVTGRNFRDEKGEGKAWTQLAPSTVAWKNKRGYSKILQNTGLLRNSFGFSSTADVAMVFGKSITGTRAGQKKSAPDIAKIHQYGTAKIPARPMLPSKDETLIIATKIYNQAIQRRIKKAK